MKKQNSTTYSCDATPVIRSDYPTIDLHKENVQKIKWIHVAKVLATDKATYILNWSGHVWLFYLQQALGNELPNYHATQKLTINILYYKYYIIIFRGITINTVNCVK